MLWEVLVSNTNTSKYDVGNGIHRVPTWRIGGYALNNTATNIYLFSMSFIAYFITGWVGLGVVLAGSFSMIMRVWDGVTDPFIGYIVDKKNKRVVAIDHGRIVRDEEGSYGFEKQNVEDDIYVPGFTTFLDPQELIAAQAQIRRGTESSRGSSRGRTIAIPEPSAYDDSLVDTYLNGGEDVYE